MVKLRSYQIDGALFLLRRRYALLADEMRVGKTPTALAAAKHFNRVLIVCPASLTAQWMREWSRWCPQPDHPAAVVLGSNGYQFNDVVIASYEQMTRHQQALSASRWDVIIADEAHYLKNPTAARTKAFYGKVAPASDRVWLLTGTPTPKTAADAWPFLKAFGVTTLKYDDWVKRYCTVDYFSGRPKATKLSFMGEVTAMMEKVMLRRTLSEVATQIPALTANPLHVAPSTAVQYVGLPVGANDIEVEEWMAKASMVGATRVEAALAKVPVLASIIADRFESGDLTATVVFGYHILPMQDLIKRLQAEDLSVGFIHGGVSADERLALTDRFRLGELDVLVVQIQAGGVGLDMSRASHGYALELDWLPGNNWQAWNRLRSFDKTEPVTIDIVTSTADVGINRVVTRREFEINQLMKGKQ